MLQDRQNKGEVAVENIRCIPLVAVQKDMLANHIAPTPLGKFAVVADQHSPLIIGIDCQVIVTCPVETRISSSPGIVTELA